MKWQELTSLLDKRIYATKGEISTIDQRIRDQFGDILCVMSTDLSGFSRQSVKEGIISALQTVRASELLLTANIRKYGGRVMKAVGDGLLITFRYVDSAVLCAAEMQRHSKGKGYNLCIGLGYGQVLITGNDVFGVEVNAACKIGEDYAQSGDILCTESVVMNLKDTTTLGYQPEPGISIWSGAIYRINWDS